MQLVRYQTNGAVCQAPKRRQKASRFWKRRGYWSAAPAKAGAFRIGAAGGWRPEKALCNSSNALLHAFSASRLERLLLLGPGGPRSARPVLLRLADFRKRGLARSAKIGALRQPHLRCLVHRTRSTRLPWSSRVGRESRGGRAGPSKVPPSPSGPSGQRPERATSADPAFC